MTRIKTPALTTELWMQAVHPRKLAASMVLHTTHRQGPGKRVMGPTIPHSWDGSCQLSFSARALTPSTYLSADPAARGVCFLISVHKGPVKSSRTARRVLPFSAVTVIVRTALNNLPGNRNVQDMAPSPYL